MAKHCPSCGGVLVWGGETTERRRAWCPACGARFHRRAGWGEVLILMAITYLPMRLLALGIFKWKNPLGLSDPARQTGLVVMSLIGIVLGVALALALTRKGRRLEPVPEVGVLSD